MRIAHASRQAFERPVDSVAPFAEHSRGGGADVEVGRIEQAFEQRLVHDVVRLVHPKRFELEPRRFGVVGAERVEPVGRGGDDVGGGAFGQFPPHSIPRAIFRFAQQFEQRVERRAGDLGRRQQRAVLVDDAPDATVRMVSVRLAQIVLQVADQRIVPVDDVQRTVGTELQIHGPKVPVVARRPAVRSPGAQARAVFAKLVLQHHQVADHVVLEKVALGFRREVATRNELATRRRPRAFDNECRVIGFDLRAAKVEIGIAAAAGMLIGVATCPEMGVAQ